eukprot:5299301-Prymnesium_polylepis.2
MVEDPARVYDIQAVLRERKDVIDVKHHDGEATCGGQLACRCDSAVRPVHEGCPRLSDNRHDPVAVDVEECLRKAAGTSSKVENKAHVWSCKDILRPGLVSGHKHLCTVRDVRWPGLDAVPMGVLGAAVLEDGRIWCSKKTPVQIGVLRSLRPWCIQLHILQRHVAIARDRLDVLTVTFALIPRARVQFVHWHQQRGATCQWRRLDGQICVRVEQGLSHELTPHHWRQATEESRDAMVGQPFARMERIILLARHPDSTFRAGVVGRLGYGAKLTPDGGPELASWPFLRWLWSGLGLPVA